MRKALKFLGLVCFMLVLFVIAGSLALYHLIRAGEMQHFLVSEIEAKTPFKVKLGEADLEMGRILGIGFNDFALSESDAAPPVITARRITARIALLPLLDRKLILYGVRLHQPTARVVRDKEGRIPLVDKLRNLPFLTEDVTQFGLDLHGISCEGGEVEFEDQQAAKVPRRVWFRDIDLEVQRIRGQRLLDFVKELANLRQPEPQGAALDFNLRGAVETQDHKTGLRARGRMVFPEEALEFEKTWWNAEIQLVNLPAELMRQYIGVQWPVKSITGALAPRLYIQGSPRGQIRLRGTVSFKQLAIEAPQLFDLPLLPGDGQTEFDVDLGRQRLGIALFDFRSKELNLTMRGETRFTASHDTHIQLKLSAPSLPLTVLRKYLPLKKIDSPQLESFLSSLQTGELQLKNAGISGTLGELQNVAQSATNGLIWLDGELSNVGVKLNANGALPLQGGQGRFRLEKGVFTFTDLKGNYGQSRLADMNGSYQLAPAGKGNLEFRATGEVDLAEFREQIRRGALPGEVPKLFASVGDLGGKGKGFLSLRRIGESAPQFEGKIMLDNARLRFEDIALTEIKGDLTLSPAEIRTEKLRALLSNSPVEIQLALINYTSEGGSFDLRVDSTGVKAGTVARLLLDTGTPEDPGIVRGSVLYQGSFGAAGERKFTGYLDLIGVKLDHKPLLEPLRELNGRVKIDETGIDFQGLNGLLVGAPFAFGGRWRYALKPQLVFDFVAPSLDVAYLISKIDPQSTDWYETLTAQGKVSLARGRLHGFEFAQLKSDLNLERRVWRLENLAMVSGGGTVQGTATVADKADMTRLAMTSRVQGVPIQTLLNWFEAGQAEITGKVNITGNLESLGQDGAERKQNLNGALSLRIEDGTIHRLRLVVQLLNLLDLSRWFTLKLPDLSKNGIRFRSISGDFTVNRGVFLTQNLIVDSDDLRMTGSGTIDVANDEIAFILAVRPFAGIDTAIGYIPVLGRSIAAIKNSFLVASFSISGPIDNPTVTPAPLSTVSEWFFGVLGIPKRIIGWGGGENSGALQNRTEREPPQENAAPAQ
ncbi:MAG: AsmA-like C-terminal domain-containing protein [Candidatus Binatia bacterium]